MIKRVFTILIAAVMLACGVITFSACTSTADGQNEKLRISDNVTYNEDGDFFEADVENMVDCSKYNYNVARSSRGEPITLYYSDEGAYFTCTMRNEGYLSATNPSQSSKTIVVGNDSSIWCYGFVSEGKESAIVELVLSVNGVYTGYAVIEIYQIGNTAYEYKARVLKSALITQNGVSEKEVSLEQIRLAIEKVIVK